MEVVGDLRPLLHHGLTAFDNFVGTLLGNPVPRPLRPLPSAAHEQAAPTIRTRIGKNAKILVALRRMLPAFEQAKPRIKVQI